MSHAIVRSGLDATVKSAYPNATYGKATRLQVKSTTHESFIFFRSPIPQNAAMTASSGVLRIKNAVAITGSVTVTVQRVGASPKWSRLTWNNKPGVVGSAVSQTIVNPTTSDWFELDVAAHLQAIANGSPNYGWKITTTSTTLVRLYSLNAAQYKPTLVAEWTDKPDIPNVLHPVNGKAVATNKPTVRMTYSDPGGDDALDAVQIQIDAAGDFTSGIDFDSGWVTSTTPELDMSATAYAGLSDGASTTLRCRVRDEAGGVSDWSDPVTFSRDDKATLAITSPGVGATVDEFTPPIDWTFTGETQKAYRVLIARAARPHTWIYDSGRVTSATTEHTLPFRWHGHRVLKDDLSYIVTVRVWDTKDRCGVAYVQQTRAFTVQYDATVTPATSLTANQFSSDSPWVVLQWQRATLPDEWVIVRDGEVIEKEETAGDLLLSGTTYQFVDRTARPMVAHTYRIRAVVNHKTASTNPSATITPVAKGVWLTNDDGTQVVHFYGDDIENVAYGESSEALVPIGAEASVKITNGMRGLSGTMPLYIRNGPDGRNWDQHKQDLLAMKAAPSTTFRLAWGDENIPVVLSNVSVSPASMTLAGSVQLRASFSFEQDGELPFEAEL